MDPLSLSDRIDMSAKQQPASVLAMRANVSQQEAVRAFRATSLAALYWRTLRGPLQRLAASYVPFRLYRVQYEMGSARHSRWFALDRVQGILDLFEFPGEPSPDRLIKIETRNRMSPDLDDDQSDSILRDKVLRVIFQQGFFRIRETRLQVQRSSVEFSMPYWVGFYGTDGSLRCRVMDAVRRRMEGGKATHLFENWLAT